MTPDSNRSYNPTEAPRWDAASTSRHAVTLARWVSLGSFGLLLCLWAAIVVSTWSVREASLGRATSSANNLSAAFCEQVYHTISTIRAAMKHVPAQHLFPCTNCGMAPMAMDLAWKKIDALAKGAAIVRKELSGL
jgi:hypothetical protein